MPDLSRLNDAIVEKSASGTDDQDQLNTSIASAWRTVLSNAPERAEVAALLGAQERGSTQPPHRSMPRSGAGTFGTEILIALSDGLSPIVGTSSTLAIWEPEFSYINGLAKNLVIGAKPRAISSGPRIDPTFADETLAETAIWSCAMRHCCTCVPGVLPLLQNLRFG